MKKDLNRDFHNISSSEQHVLFVWNKLQLVEPEPIKAEILRIRKTKCLYRLFGADGKDLHIIAKNSSSRNMLVEKRIYQEILPVLPLTTLHFYGFVEDKNTESFWIFSEDAGGERYSESIPSHQALASNWLGILHGATGKTDLAGTLPPIGPDNYLFYLHSAHQNIMDNTDNPSLRKDDVSFLEGVIGLLDAIESSWNKIERFCDQIPPCLVHNDFYGQNVRVRIKELVSSLRVFDWERACWGFPAEDVAGLDLRIYWKIIRKYQPKAFRDLSTVEKLINVGRIFRYLSFVDAYSSGLSCKWIEQTLKEIEASKAHLVEACRLVEINTPDKTRSRRD